MVELLDQSNLLNKEIGRSHCKLGLQAVLKVIFTLELIAKHALTHNFIKALKGLLYTPECPPQNMLIYFVSTSLLCLTRKIVLSVGDFSLGYQRICCARGNFSSIYK